TTLKRLEEQDIIEEVEGPTPWMSPIVIVPKKSGGVRLCVDMREANKAIKRERHPMPTIEDMINDLNCSTVFSRIDLQQAFYQLELNEESRFITTFSTHVGLRQFKRLMFGVNAAPEIFQHALGEVLRDIPGVTHFIDDIIVHCKTKREHDHSLTETLNRLHQRGAKLNKDKCLFGVNQLTFLGHTFGEHGIFPEPQKVKAITNTAPPTSVSELRSFLGMTQFVSRYIESYATITEPLRKLTRKSQPWRWGKAEGGAFKKLKEALTKVGVMAYFDPKKQTDILVDASPCGLGAMITQEGRVICYASRALTDVESRYSQTEREMLAVVYGVEKFHVYLYGSTFTVTTDHKPLLGIIGSSKPCSARIDRWRLRLMPYEFKLIYKPGRDEANPADYLSRHPFTQPTKDNDGENYIRYVTNTAVPNALTLEEVRDATSQDSQLQAVMTAITTGKWTANPLSTYKTLKDELSAHDGVILRQNRIVIPEVLQKQVVKLAHASHQGVVKTKQLIREKVWFPGIDKMVEDHLKGCLPCQASVNTPKQRDPLHMSPLPKRPWDELSVDFAGPFPTGEHLLIVIDDYSRFPEVEIVNSTSARSVTPKLNQIFARFGTPSVLKSDNGSPFNGEEFASFAKKMGFHHRKITP
ncbi:transposon ty3-g Gag-Pol polyprotein, partial [Plakobranchus ocellatus]